MVAEQAPLRKNSLTSCSLAKISMVAEPDGRRLKIDSCCSLAKILMVAEQTLQTSW